MGNTSNTSSSGDLREPWLQSAISRLRPAYAKVGLTLPATIHVSVGFPSTRALSSSKRRIGECWMSAASRDGNPHIFISPLIETGTEALACLVHELIHASGIKNHRADFARPATLLGLTGKMASTVAGPELTERLNALLSKLGPYPHAPISTLDRPTKKQSTRLLKATCGECDCIIRLTAKVVDDPGLPTCACGGQFQLELGE